MCDSSSMKPERQGGHRPYRMTLRPEGGPPARPWHSPEEPSPRRPARRRRAGVTPSQAAAGPATARPRASPCTGASAAEHRATPGRCDQAWRSQEFAAARSAARAATVHSPRPEDVGPPGQEHAGPTWQPGTLTASAGRCGSSSRGTGRLGEASTASSTRSATRRCSFACRTAPPSTGDAPAGPRPGISSLREPCACSQSPLGHQLTHTDRESRYTVPRGRTQRCSKSRTSAATSKSLS